MAPSAMVDSEPMQVPVHVKKQDSTVTASVLHGPFDLRIEERIIEEPGIGELQVALRSTGICGSDVSYYKKFANGDLCACMPLSLGHESSGVVVAVGPQVGGFAVGDRVALEVGVPCGCCGICREGRYNLCKKMRFRSSAKSYPHFQGTLQERINHPASWCHKLPDNVSFDAAALLEPLSVAIHAVNRARPSPGSTALVIGAGTVGLLTAAMAQQSGCSEVTITDVDPGRVRYALEKGFATHGHVTSAASGSSSSSSPTSSAESSAASSGTSTPAGDSGVMTPASVFSVPGRLEGARALAAEILSLTRPPPDLALEDEDEGVDMTFECTGKEVCMHTGLYATRPGGKLIMVGMGTPIQTLPMSVAHLREIDILGIFRYANTYPTGIRMLRSAAARDQKHQQQQQQQHGRPHGGDSAGGFTLPRLDDMVTHRFRGLASAKGAFELAGRTVDDDGNLVLKVVIEA